MADRPPITDIIRNNEAPNPWVAMVAAFHLHRLENTLPSSPEMIADGRFTLNLRHLQEELDEIKVAVLHGDFPEIADGIIDLVYVAIGFGLRLGLPMDALFTEVHIANMEKVHNPDAHATLDKRVIKPEGWQKPRVAEIIKEVQSRDRV